MKVSVALLCQAAVVLASPVERRLHAEKTVDGRAVTVTEMELSNLKFFAQYAAAGYCNSDAAVGSPVTCGDNGCPDVMANNATIVGALNAGTFTDIDGFVAVDPARKAIVFSLRGSASVRNWITDFIFTQVPSSAAPGALVHTGFATAWAEIKTAALASIAAVQAAHPGFPVVVTGHSLGAAVGTLATVDLRNAGTPVDLYTYGSPRVGNGPFVDFVTAQPGAEYRVTHLDDPVPRLPPILFNYRHTSPEYWLRGGNATTTAYGAADIQVCTGTANIMCNGGTLGFDGDAHSYYFQRITGCGPSGTSFRSRRARRAEERDMSDAELEAKLNAYVQADIAYVKEHNLS